jgi:hypothetical protein
MFADIQLSETVQTLIVCGLAVIILWFFIVSIAIFQLAKEVSDFLANERERRGHERRDAAKPIERWDARQDQ